MADDIYRRLTQAGRTMIRSSVVGSVVASLLWHYPAVVAWMPSSCVDLWRCKPHASAGFTSSARSRLQHCAFCLQKNHRHDDRTHSHIANHCFLQYGSRSRRGTELFLNPSSEKDSDKKEHTFKALQLLKRYMRSLGKGILFAKPMRPTVAHVLFSIRGKRKNEKESLESPTVSFTLRECLVAIGIYLLTGICFYSILMEHWTLIDAVYFSVTCFTTVGYGDIFPHTCASKIFTCFFSLGGIAFLAAALASIGSHLVEAEMKTIRVAEKVSRRSAMRVFDRMPRMLGRIDKDKKKEMAAAPVDNLNVTAVVPFNAADAFGGVAAAPQAKPKTVKRIVGEVLLKLIPPFALLISGGVALGRLEGWAWTDSIYYSIITCGTVGLGDFAPTTQRARLWAVLFIPLAVAAGGEILGTIASALLQHRRHRVFESLVEKDLTMDHIKAMDNDNDGEVSRLEYMEFMLVEMQLVEKSVLDELKNQFLRLDMTSSNSLTKEDLIVMAKLRRSNQEKKSRNKVDEESKSIAE